MFLLLCFPFAGGSGLLSKAVGRSVAATRVVEVVVNVKGLRTVELVDVDDVSFAVLRDVV